MIIWLDAQLPPALAPWIEGEFGIECHALRDVGLRDATDREIFNAAKDRGAVIMTKDSDFVTLQDQYGSPPEVIWLTCGNTSNRALRAVLMVALPQAIALFEGGERLVEISGHKISGDE